MKKKNYKLNIGGTDERDLEQAIENSMKEGGGQQRLGQQGLSSLWFTHPNK